MNLKSVRLFPNFQRQLSQKKVSPTLQNSIQENDPNSNLTINESHDTDTNNFLVMFESDVKKYWGI